MSKKDATQANYDRLVLFARIDKHNLDEELSEQPESFSTCARFAAEFIANRDVAKDMVKRVDAEVDSNVRTDAENDGKKITETAILTQVTRSDEHQEAVDRVHKAAVWADRWSALRDVFAQRGHLLRDLCSLSLAGYYGSNSHKGESTKVVSEEAYDDKRRKVGARRRARADS